MTDTETRTSASVEAAETRDPAVNAWEEALIADLRANGGRPSSGPLAGQTLLVLYSTGAKTGARRRSVLTYSQDSGDLIVAGTAGGSTTTPAWVANLRANPDATVELGADTVPVHATIIGTGAERDRLWDQHVAQFPNFGEYPAKTGGRMIPLIRLTPGR